MNTKVVVLRSRIAQCLIALTVLVCLVASVVPAHGQTAVVNAVSVTPNAGTGLSQLFTLQYTDSLGATDLSSARVRFGASNVGPGTCTVWYDAAAATIKLMNDGGVWGSPVPVGAGTLSNSQCTVHLASTTATPTDNNLMLALSVTFASAFTGLKNIYMLAGSATGPSSGWIQRGTWTPNVVVGSAVVDAMSVTPNSGSGATQTFTLQYTDSLGASDLSSARVRFGSSNVGPATCTAWYDATTATIKLMDDAGAWGAPVALGSGTLANSQCTVNLASSTATPTGNTLTLVLNITFAGGFTGLKNTYMFAGSATGPSSGWIQRGTWTPNVVVGPAAVSAVSVTPNSGSGATQAFTLTYTDSLGASDLASARVRFGASNVGPGTCTAWYDATTATIKLMDDAGAWGAPAALGGGTLANSQCTLNLASSTATPSGNTLTLVLNVTFAGGFSGLKNIYMLAGSATGPNSGWIHHGTWTPSVGGPAVVEAVSSTPNAGSGTTQSFTLQYSSSLGAGDLSSARVRFAAANTGPGTCSAWYDATTATIKLMDDAGAWGAPVALGSGTLANSQCTLNLASSTATPNGNTLTLVLNITFAGGFTGLKNVYMFAGSATGPSSGWIQRGTWTTAATLQSISVTPSSGSGLPGAPTSFTATYSNAAGVDDFGYVYLRLGTTPSGPSNTCMIRYEPATRILALRDDSGTRWLPVIIGHWIYLRNSQCLVLGGRTYAQTTGQTLTLTVEVEFFAASIGDVHTSLYASSRGGTVTGWQERGAWTVLPEIVTADSVSPSSGTGAQQTFDFRYSHTSGAGHIQTVWARFSPDASVNSDCRPSYNVAQNLLTIFDPMTGQTGGALGSNRTLQTSLCSVNLAMSSAVVSGNTLTLTLAMGFTVDFGGPKQIVLSAVGDDSTRTTDGIVRGEWIVPGATLSLDPIWPGPYNDRSQLFSTQFSASLGIADLAFAYVKFAPFDDVAEANRCILRYENATGLLSLRDDFGVWLPDRPLAGSGTLENSQCSIDLANSLAITTTYSLRLFVAMTFRPSYEGQHGVSLFATDSRGVSVGWRRRNSLRVPGTISGDWVAPHFGSETARTFSAQYSDLNGVGDIAFAYLKFSEVPQDTQNICGLRYDRAAGLLSLSDDAGNWQPGVALPGVGTMENSRCAIALVNSSVVIAGNAITLYVHVTFKPGWGGFKGIYMSASTVGGAVFDWYNKGSWEVP